MKSQYKIPLVKDTISKSDIKKLSKWLVKDKRLTKGSLTVEFEKKWSEWNGSKYSIFVNSGSSANLLMIYALLLSGRLKNDKAIVPAVSWVTTVSPFIQYGMEPILCDCDPDNLGFDVEHFEKLCKEHRPSVAIIVHVLGHPNKMDEIMKICKKYDVILLEDCCEAHGSMYKSKKVGTFGLTGSFSFYYGHHMSTIEGGMVVTDDRELYNLMLSIRSHGWSRDLEPKYARALRNKYKIDNFREKYSFYHPGFNLRPTDLNAFLGIEQLKRLDKTVKKREERYFRYKKLLEDHFWIQTSEADTISSFSMGLQTPYISEVSRALEKSSVEIRPLVCGSIGEQPFWIERFGKTILPNATKIHNNGMYLPGSQDLLFKEIDFICKVLIDAQEKAALSSITDLSIVVCVKNSEDNIENSLASIKKAAPDAELIIIDADSSDQTIDIAKKYTRRIYSDKRRGLSYARQLGIDKSTKQFVAFVGADDNIERKTLEDLLVSIKKDLNVAGVQAKTIIESPQTYWEKATKYIFELLLNQTGSVSVIGTPCVFRKDVIKKIRYDSNITGGTDDTDLCMRLRQKGYELKKIDTNSYEIQDLDFRAFSNRWKFYGKGDYQFYNKYNDEWSLMRKIQSIFHPFSKYIVGGSISFIKNNQAILVPALFVAVGSRYYGWIKEGF